MWMTTLKRRHDRLNQAEVTLVLNDAAELEALAGLLGSKIEIKRVPPPEWLNKEEPK